MKPLPAQHIPAGKTSAGAIPAMPGQITSPPEQFSTANRRASNPAAHRAYPWLLSASTATAALFCLLYITKPVIVTSSAPTPEEPAASNTPALAASGASSHSHSLMPSSNQLPGETLPSAIAGKPIPAAPRSLPESSASNPFEETNLRIQHILTAEAPGGHVDRIDIDVPVLYQSRSLRWKSEQVAEARDLLVRLMDYQDKSRQLRAEGIELLDAWNHLVGTAIPASVLRADSPSLPANQEDAADTPRPAGLITTESIQIQTQEK